jgi:bifunctional UDP-N-acetylglucosamine pyrophosphorylase / glucosamine-1-phosphate N-acetyltransferase
MAVLSDKLSTAEYIKSYSAPFDGSKKETSVILAAGHGKRIKSQTSKMLHKIWGVPTVERVRAACRKGLSGSNTVIVVGIKAEEVVETVGKKDSVSYAYQEFQKGTGHALQIALENITDKNYDGTVFVFPGDMGLIDAETITFFKEEFEKSGSDMMVLTGIFEGPAEENYYGRIVRAKEDISEGAIPERKGKVIEILEYKDILGLDENEGHRVKYDKSECKFTTRELIENREFNSGVYAFKFKPLNNLIGEIKSDNVQNEIYVTDLIALFNQNGYSVGAVSPKEQYVLMGFNNKSVLKEMEGIERKIVYAKLKDIITIDDADDFFIDESVVGELLGIDSSGRILDIRIGKGAYIGKGVKPGRNLTLMKNAFLDGDIRIGEDVIIMENARISCFYNQKIEIGDRVEILSGGIIKGNVSIGSDTRLETDVRITGNDQFPVVIGTGVVIKGVSYIFGSKIDSNIIIEHSVIERKQIAKPENLKAKSFSVRFYLPETEGKEAVKNL